MGVNVCLGTDSLASNETLSILDEMRFLHRQSPGVPVWTLLKMGTINGAVALGWQDKIGSVAPGKEADLIAIPLSGTQSDPLMDILRSAVQPELTMVQGRRVKL
jgi:cytosine/adenosine deaminase-related metal-dependent hydrolase